MRPTAAVEELYPDNQSSGAGRKCIQRPSVDMEEDVAKFFPTGQ